MPAISNAASTTDGAGGPDATAIVREYLALMQARDLQAAARLLAPGFSMQFPGAATMHRLEDLVQWAGARYRSAAKQYELQDECPTPTGTIVYCAGTLHGVWLDGTSFAGIRFIDRFEIVGGLIRRQDVWNDMGEARAARSSTATTAP